MLGGTIGAEAATPTEVEPAPEPLINDLREAVPQGHSAIVLPAASSHVDAMLSALGKLVGEEVLRHPLTVEQASAIVESLSAAPPASRGPSLQGDEPVPPPR